LIKSLWLAGHVDNTFFFLCAIYYNQTRIHLTLRKDARSWRSVQRVGRVVVIPVFGGYITSSSGYDYRKKRTR